MPVAAPWSLNMIARRPTLLITVALLPLACGQPGDERGEGDTNPGSTTLPGPTSGPDTGTSAGDATVSTTRPGLDSTTTPDDSSDTNPFVFDVGTVADVSGGCGGGVATNATLSGTVWAPNGQIPISGAIVYTTAVPPQGIPQQVYCDECQPINCDDFITYTEPDGSFQLGTLAANARYLVVRKGQFMRVTQIDIAEGNTNLAPVLTTLPGVNNPAAGLYIPRIAVAYGAYDRIEDALGKFGLGQTAIANFEENLVPGTQPFDIWNNGSTAANDGFVALGTLNQLVADPNLLDDYHIIFVPCSGNTHTTGLNAAAINNIRNWVAAGGRWYVADWSNEWMEHVFPDYQTLMGEPNNADLGSYDSNATVLDPDLLAWLLALPNALKDINPLNNEAHPTLFNLPAFVTTVDNWSVVSQVHPVLVPDGMGGQVDVGHKVWLEGPGGGQPVHPLTVSGTYGCGRIQFTSYHTAEFFDYVGLSPQELVLLYTILEIGVCQENPLPPPQG
jgi:hypothetical protein